MNKLVKKRQYLIVNFIIIISFLLFSILSVSLIWIHGTLYFTRIDGFFHLSRVLEMFKSGGLPSYAMNSYDETGSAVITMYPYIFLYPLVWLLKILSLKHAILLFYILVSVITSLISYFGSFSVTHDRRVSYLFALIYSFSGEFMAMSFYSRVTDIGVYFSAIFLPLVIFGAIHYVNTGRWLMLSCGMSLIVCSNLISVAFIAVLLIIWLMINYRLMTIHKFLNLVKAALLTVIATAMIWIPILKISLYNHIFIPTFKHMGFVNLPLMFHNALCNSFALGCQSLTFYTLLGSIVGLLFILNMSPILRKLYIFAILIVFLSSTWFPWQVLVKNHKIFLIMLHLQTTIRLLVIPQMILEFILAYCLVKYFKKYLRITFIIAVLIALVMTQAQIQHDYINRGSKLISIHVGTTNQHQIIKSSLHFHNTDYWPKAALRLQHHIFRHNSYYHGVKIHFAPKGNGAFDVNVPNPSQNIKRLTLPFLYYYGTHYQCYVDGKLTKSYINKYHLMTLHDVPKGRQHIQVNIVPSRTIDLQRGITIIGLLVYGLGIVKRRKRLINFYN